MTEYYFSNEIEFKKAREESEYFDLKYSEQLQKFNNNEKYKILSGFDQ